TAPRAPATLLHPTTPPRSGRCSTTLSCIAQAPAHQFSSPRLHPVILQPASPPSQSPAPTTIRAAIHPATQPSPLQYSPPSAARATPPESALQTCDLSPLLPKS